MDSISEVLGNKDFSEPEEVERLKSYIKAEYNALAEIRVSSKGLAIIVDSSGLASALRLNLPAIKRSLSINDRIYIRIR